MIRIISGHIENFGKLNNYDFRFEKGLNTVIHENGWGKSTMAAFIKAMFYGMKKNNKADIDQNERKKYQPWQGGNYGGNLTFELDGNNYKIERFFNKNEDFFNLIDLSTNKSYAESAFKGNLGEYVFKINKEGFENSLFLGQKNIEDSDHKKNANESLSAKLNEAAVSDDMTKFNGAMKYLENERFILKKTGNKGKIADTEERINKINRALNENAQRSENVDELTAYLKRIETDIKTKEETAEKLNEKVLKANAVSIIKENLETLKTMREDIEKEKSKLVGFEKVLNGNAVLEEYNEKYYEMKGLEKEIKEKEGACADKKHRILPYVLGIIGILGLIPAFLSLNTALFIPVLAVSVAFIAAAVVLYVIALRKTAVINSDFNKKKERFEALHNDILHYLKGFDFEDVDFGVTDVFAEQLELLKNINQNKIIIENNILSKEKAFEEFKKVKNLTENEDLPDISVFSVQAESKSANAELNALRGERQSILNKIDKNTLLLNESDELLGEKERLSEELKELKQRLFIIEKTKEFLTDANDKMRGRYLEPLKNGMDKYVKIITEKAAENITIDTDFNIYAEEFGIRREFNTLSTGYKDIFNFTFRLALTDALFSETEQPFIVLDDPFVNFDKHKLTLVMDLLNEIALSRQIIYFICHDSRTATEK